MLWAEKEGFDLVLLDLMLPGLTGEEFIARVRQHGTMPIIVDVYKRQPFSVNFPAGEEEQTHRGGDGRPGQTDQPAPAHQSPVHVLG